MSIDPVGDCCGPGGPQTRPATRRDFLCRAGGGFGLLALASLLDGAGLLTRGFANAPAAPKESKVEEELKKIEPDALTPKQALEILYTLKLPSGSKVLTLAPSHHNHALGESVGIRLDVDEVVAFPPTGSVTG